MKRVRLTESDLRNIVKKSVKRILKESDEMGVDSVNKLATMLTDLDQYTAEFVAREIEREIGPDFDNFVNGLEGLLDPEPYGYDDEMGAYNG